MVLPGLDGVGLVQEARRRDPDIEAVAVTGHDDVRLAVQAMKAGCAEFLTKPVDRGELAEVADAGAAAGAAEAGAHPAPLGEPGVRPLAGHLPAGAPDPRDAGGREAAGPGPLDPGPRHRRPGRGALACRREGPAGAPQLPRAGGPRRAPAAVDPRDPAWAELAPAGRAAPGPVRRDRRLLRGGAPGRRGAARHGAAGRPDPRSLRPRRPRRRRHGGRLRAPSRSRTPAASRPWSGSACATGTPAPTTWPTSSTTPARSSTRRAATAGPSRCSSSRSTTPSSCARRPAASRTAAGARAGGGGLAGRARRRHPGQGLGRASTTCCSPRPTTSARSMFQRRALEEIRRGEA